MPTQHPCPARGCPELVSEHVVGCARHWRAVPTHLRNPLIGPLAHPDRDPDATARARRTATNLIRRYAARADTPEDQETRRP